MTHDPVCCCEVDELDAMTHGFTTDASGQVYYFCSADCKRQFDEEPSRFMTPPGEDWETHRIDIEDY
jgi:YHS domain-containing protein